ncbi:MAG TPA: low affinity iron permease family protein [Pirellulaceae bacterium]|nr:low affinity iron permease family protein [Pirellulaceae bacterium]
MQRLNRVLEKFSQWATAWTGSTWAFAMAVGVIVVWSVTGPIFGFSDTWQLVINTGTTIVTFLMVFLIQRAQNKDALAIQVKLNELLASQQGASNRLINVEDWSEDEINALHQRFAKLSKRLENTADACEPHSIAETKEIVKEAEELTEEAEGALEEVREGQQRDRFASLPRPHPR